MAEGSKKPKRSYITENKHDIYEVASALQKAVRRGDEELAMYWAYEMWSAGNFYWMLNRLRIISQEDVGIGDPALVVFACQSIEYAERWYKQDGEWQLAIANVILALCRARKSRIADEFYNAIFERRKRGWKPEVPDYALDRHTSRGKKLDRGMAHFVEVASHLENVNDDVVNPYKAEAEKHWNEADEADRKGEFTAVHKQAAPGSGSTTQEDAFRQ